MFTTRNRSLAILLAVVALSVLMLVNEAESLAPEAKFYSNQAVATSNTYLWTRTGEPDLPSIHSLNSATGSHHFTFVGCWIVYGGLNYSATGGTPMCSSSSSEGTISLYKSFRYAGDPWDIDVPTLSFFQLSRYGGQQTLIQEDSPNIVLDANSVVRSGEASWSLYTGVNYSGFKFCMSMSSNFYIEDITAIIPGVIKSVRMGCDA